MLHPHQPDPTPRPRSEWQARFPAHAGISTGTRGGSAVHRCNLPGFGQVGHADSTVPEFIFRGWWGGAWGCCGGGQANLSLRSRRTGGVGLGNLPPGFLPWQE
jgi:hypothetical protein